MNTVSHQRFEASILLLHALPSKIVLHRSLKYDIFTKQLFPNFPKGLLFFPCSSNIKGSNSFCK